MSDQPSPFTPIVAEVVGLPPIRSDLPQPGPVTAAGRIESLDVLRGFALLGILVMNIQSFAMPAAAYMNPTAYGDLGGANYQVWYWGHLLVDRKFMAMFSMLFGAGIVLMSRRREAAGGTAAGLHYRRMGVLAVIGLLHAYLLWEGDILFLYAICGMIVYPMRRLPAPALVVLGVAVISVASLFFLLIGLSMRFWPAEDIVEFTADWAPTAEQVEQETAEATGGWLSEFLRRAPIALSFQTVVLLTWGLWRAGGLMLVGMALARWGVLYGRSAWWVYALMVLVGFTIGLPVIRFGVGQQFAHAWATDYGMFLGSQYNYWASLPASLGWIGLVMLVMKTPLLAILTRPLAAVGRMALSNYLFHSLVATMIFYGHGFGLFGQVERTGQIQIVAAIWLVQLVMSPLWLHWFRFGPAEWLWRSLSYGKWQPMWRRARSG